MTAAEFKAAFPVFTSTPDATVDLVISAAAPFFNVGEWDDLLTDGLGNYVAHKLTMQGLSLTGAMASAGAGASKTVGRVSISSSQGAVGIMMADPFQRTIYGQTYAALARQVGAMAGPVAV